MADPWIRVHARLRERPVVARLAEALRIDPHKAMGHLVDFWGGVSANARHGHVADLPDSLLEHWAGWNGKRGAFAAWVRAQHLDEEGRVREWDDYAGALETRREKERQRLAEKRTVLRNTLRTVAQQDADGCKMLQPARANETRRDETRQEQLPPPHRASVAENGSDPFWHDDRVTAFLDAIPAGKHRAWRAILAGWRTGDRRVGATRPTDDQIADGLVAALTARDEGPLGEAFVAGCIRRASVAKHHDEHGRELTYLEKVAKGLIVLEDIA